jgi:mono/diheme cytochrome c family protein
MSEEPKSSPVPPAGGEPPKTTSSYLLLGGAFVVILILAIVVMLFLTGGDVAETKAPTTLSATAAEGKTLFQQAACYTCHPSEGRAGGIGPRLSTTNISDDTIRNTIRKGRGSMPANPQLTDDQINKIIAYIRALKPA